MDQHFDLMPRVDAPVSNAPWYFRLGRFLSRKHIRGGDRLLAEARRRGFLDRLALYSLSDNVNLAVPLWRPCNQWDEQDVRAYEAAFMRALTAAVCQMPGDVTVVDCGADIGTVSAHLVAKCGNVKTIVAFEPNPAAYPVLQQNLAHMGVAGGARNAAVGNFSGNGRLVSAVDDPSAHAMYIEPCADGNIPVERVDDLGLAPLSCVIKIDVEGSESLVVQGAERTIRESKNVLVAFEAHYRVFKRTGEDPVEIMQMLKRMRSDFEFDVDTTPTQQVSADRPFFSQLPPNRVYNIMARSFRA